jgi:hypothetical protein
MRPALTNPGVLIRRLAVVAFGLWLCGAGCALCCKPFATAAYAQTLPGAARASHATSAPARCHSHPPQSATNGYGLAAAPAREPSPTDDHAGSCCQVTRRLADAARKQHPANERAVARASVKSSRSGAGARNSGRPAAWGRSPDGRATHVRCCVFLI